MPVERCTVDGKSGWRWGKQGKCYTGPGAKTKAAKQGAAIKAQGTMISQPVDDTPKIRESFFNDFLMNLLQITKKASD